MLVTLHLITFEISIPMLVQQVLLPPAEPSPQSLFGNSFLLPGHFIPVLWFSVHCCSLVVGKGWEAWAAVGRHWVPDKHSMSLAAP